MINGTGWSRMEEWMAQRVLNKVILSRRTTHPTPPPQPNNDRPSCHCEPNTKRCVKITACVTFWLCFLRLCGQGLVIPWVSHSISTWKLNSLSPIILYLECVDLQVCLFSEQVNRGYLKICPLISIMLNFPHHMRFNTSSNFICLMERGNILVSVLEPESYVSNLFIS